LSVIQKLAGETAAYGFSSVIGRLLNYLLVPLYTTVFQPEQYGEVTELYAYVAFLNVLYTYGLETAYFRFSSEEHATDYYSLAFFCILITSLAFSSLLYFNASEISKLLGYDGKEHFIQWLSLILAIDAIVAIPFARIRKEGKALRFASYKTLNILLNIGFNLFFLIFCPYWLELYPESIINTIYQPSLGVGYVFLSNFLANASYLILLAPYFIRVSVRFQWANLMRMLNYAWPILIIGFAGVMNEMLSRAILKHRLPEGFYVGYSNLEALGIFGACYKLSVFMTLAVQAYRYAFEPFLFRQAQAKDSPEVFSKIMVTFVFFTSVAWVSISLLLPVIAPIFLRQDSYLEALPVVPLLLGGALMLGVFYNLSIWYKLKDKTLYGASISLIGALLTFVLNWFLIPFIGYLGSAIATFLVYTTMAVISYLWGKRFYAVPYPVPRILGYLFFAGLVIFIDQMFVGDILFSVLLLVFYLFLLFLVDRKQIRAFLQ
jgi:O-antigen/teichoic acid export membrane protein